MCGCNFQVLHDFHLVNKPRILELCEQEYDFFLKYSAEKARPPPEGQIRGITEEEAKERDDLLAEVRSQIVGCKLP